MTGNVRLSCGNAKAEIACEGAELRRWSVAGRELLWEPNPEVWGKVAPLLFPVVGWSRGGEVKVDGRRFAMGVHGFASGMRFALAGSRETEAEFRLEADAETLASYPFRFDLKVRYQLREAALEAAFTVTNAGERALSYALGIHPGFRWPFSTGARDDCRIVFERDEEPAVPEISAAGLFRNTRRPVPLVGRTLPLDGDLLAREALCFLDAKSRRLRFEAPDGAAIVVEVEEFPHWAIWSRPPAPFLSIESWTGHGDPENFEGDMAQKPSMRMLPAGEIAVHRVRYSFEERAQ